MEWRSLCEIAPWSSSLWHLCSNHWVDFIMKPLTTFSFVPTITAALEYHFVWFVEKYSYKFNNAEHHICQATGWLATSQKTQISIHSSLGTFFGTSMFITVVFVLSRCVGSWHSMKGSPFCCLLCHPQPTMSTVPPRLHNVYCATHRRKCYATASRSPRDTRYYCVWD